MSRIVFVFLLLFSVNTFANRARNLVAGMGDAGIGLLSGSGDSGSLYIKDEYNIIYNPVYLHDFGSRVVLERANDYEDENSAMLFFLDSVGPVRFGVGVNREREISDYLNDQDGNPGTQRIPVMRPLDLMVGMKTGFQWGLGVSFAGYEVKQSESITDEANHIVLRAGARVLGAEPFIFGRTSGTETQENRTYRRHRWGAGVRYPLGDWTPYAMWQQVTRDTTTKYGQPVHSWGLGIARHVVLRDFEIDAYTGFFRTAIRNVIPIGVLISAPLAKWIAFQGGLLFRLHNQSGLTAAQNSTTGRMGVKLTFGHLDLEGVLAGSGPGFSSNDTSYEANTLGVMPIFFTAFSLTYRLDDQS